MDTQTKYTIMLFSTLLGFALWKFPHIIFINLLPFIRNRTEEDKKFILSFARVLGLSFLLSSLFFVLFLLL